AIPRLPSAYRADRTDSARLAGMLPVSPTVPDAETLPPVARLAERLSIFALVPASEARPAIPVKRRLNSGSTYSAPLVETEPANCGLERLPPTCASKLAVPEARAPRSAMKRLAKASGAEPDRLNARPLPAIGTRPEPVTERPPLPFAVTLASVTVEPA